jgi:hypothetical protein
MSLELSLLEVEQELANIALAATKGEAFDEDRASYLMQLQSQLTSPVMCCSLVLCCALLYAVCCAVLCCALLARAVDFPHTKPVYAPLLSLSSPCVFLLAVAVPCFVLCFAFAVCCALLACAVDYPSLKLFTLFF